MEIQSYSEKYYIPAGTRNNGKISFVYRPKVDPNKCLNNSFASLLEFLFQLFLCSPLFPGSQYAKYHSVVAEFFQSSAVSPRELWFFHFLRAFRSAFKTLPPLILGHFFLPFPFSSRLSPRENRFTGPTPARDVSDVSETRNS